MKIGTLNPISLSIRKIALTLNSHEVVFLQHHPEAGWVTLNFRALPEMGAKPS